jgi:hypothetical protein
LDYAAEICEALGKSNKNDTIGAVATQRQSRPAMLFVQVEQTEQTDLQALHRIPHPCAETFRKNVGHL